MKKNLSVHFSDAYQPSRFSPRPPYSKKLVFNDEDKKKTTTRYSLGQQFKVKKQKYHVRIQYRNN